MSGPSSAQAGSARQAPAAGDTAPRRNRALGMLRLFVVWCVAGGLAWFGRPGTEEWVAGLVLAGVSDRIVELPDGTQVPAQAALLTALDNANDVNILSAPNILTTDNEEAEIIVGQNVPFVASRATSETNLDNTFATIEREDVGITLRLTPQISEGSMVRLASSLARSRATVDAESFAMFRPSCQT